MGDEFTENGEGAPKGECLKGKDEFHASTVCNGADEREVSAEQVFFLHVTWCRELLEGIQNVGLEHGVTW